MGAPNNKQPSATSVLALVIAAFAVVLALSLSPGTKTVVKTASPQAALKAQAKVAVVAAQTTPAPTCSVPKDQGTLGACAPKPQFELAATLLRASGTRLAPLAGPKGVDVSSYQSCRAAPSLVQFVYIKYTESTGYHDRCAPINASNARVRGQAYGGYDFLRPGGSSPTAEADSFVDYGNRFGGFKSMPPVADVEATRLSPGATSAYVCTWTRRVKARTGRMPIIYTGKWFWDPQTSHNNCGAQLWLSAYASFFYLPVGFPRAAIWQYSDGVFGPQPHINGWDSDVFLGSKLELDLLSNKIKPIKPIPAHRQEQCRHLHRLYLRAHRLHHRTGHWLGKPGQKRRAHLRHVLAKAHFACKAGKAVRKP